MKISSTVLLVSPAEHVQIYKKMCFIFNDKCIGDSNTYNESGTGQLQLDRLNQKFILDGCKMADKNFKKNKTKETTDQNLSELEICQRQFNHYNQN